MHDPDTLVCRFLGFNVWHHDPQTDGTDDSCGWSSPRPNKKQLGNLRFSADREAEHPWFMQRKEKHLSSAAEGEALLRGLFIVVSGILRVPISLDEAGLWACEMVHNPIDNMRGGLVFFPGYHSNFAEDRVEDRRYEARRLYYAVARYILRERRPWWRHPRFHFHHWQITRRKK